jgi:hypothetical protein
MLLSDKFKKKSRGNLEDLSKRHLARIPEHSKGPPSVCASGRPLPPCRGASSLLVRKTPHSLSGRPLSPCHFEHSEKSLSLARGRLKKETPPFGRGKRNGRLRVRGKDVTPRFARGDKGGTLREPTPSKLQLCFPLPWQ